MIKALLASLVLLVSLDSQAAQPVFVVTKKQGKIFIKGPLELAWHPLRTKIIPLGTLLRVDRLSSVEFSLQGSEINADDVKTKIKINQPLITSLDEDLVRRSQLKDYPMKSLWDSGGESAKANKDFPMLSFASAFIRSIVTLDRAPKIPDIAYKDDPAGVEIGANIQSIKILSPGPDGLFFLSNGKASIPIIWEAPANGLNYRLYVWEETAVRTRPVASIPDVWYQMELEKTGRYKIQVEDETHKYRSESIVITVDRPLASMIAEDKHSSVSHLAEVLLVSPYSRATQFLKDGKKPYTQFFSWEDKVGLDKGEFYRLMITRKDSKEKPKRIKTKEFSAQVNLDPGTYTWIVQKMSSEREKNPKSSDPRTLQIRVGSPVLSTVVHEGPSQTLYFDLK